MLIRLHPRGIYDKSPRDLHKYPRDFINTPEIKCCLKSPKGFGIFIFTLLIPQYFVHIIEFKGGMDYRSLCLGIFYQNGWYKSVVITANNMNPKIKKIDCKVVKRLTF